MENVQDPNLRRELKQLVRENPDFSILDVRAEAIKWQCEGGAVKQRANFYAVPT